MKQLIITLSLILVITHKIAIAQDDNGLYSRRYQRLDIDTILASPRLVTNYVDCLLNKKPCPPEGKALKKILPEALRTKCGKCWPNQKEGALKVITVLYNDYPQHYNALKDKWDPTGEYHRRFKEYLQDQSFNSIGSNINNNFQENNDINQGQQTQVTSTIVDNSKNKPSVTSSNSNKITLNQSSNRTSTKLSTIQNHPSSSHRILSNQSHPSSSHENLSNQNRSSSTHKISNQNNAANKRPSTQNHTHNDKQTKSDKSTSQNSNTVLAQNHVQVSNKIPPTQAPIRHFERLQLYEIPSYLSDRVPSVQNYTSPLNRVRPTSTHSSRIQLSTVSSVPKRKPSVQNMSSTSGTIPQNSRTIPQNSNKLTPQPIQRNYLPPNPNRFLSVETPLFNFNILPSIQNIAPVNRFRLTTASPQITTSSNQNHPFNFNIIPSIQTALNLNRVPLVFPPPNRFSFIQPSSFPAPHSIRSVGNAPKSIQNENLNEINRNRGENHILSNQVAFRFSNNERSPENDISYSQRTTPNIPKPTKISTTKIRPTTKVPTTRSVKTKISTARQSFPTQIPRTRQNNINNLPLARQIENYNQEIIQTEVTQRPINQINTITVRPIVTQPTTIIRQSTTSRPATKRLTTKRSITTKVTSEATEINPSNEVINRYGSDDENVAPSTSTTTATRRSPRPTLNQSQPQRPQQPVSSDQPQYLPGFPPTTTFTSNNHILNIINRLTTKLSNTADFVAGVLRVPQAIIENTRNRHRVIWQNFAKNIPPPIQKRTTLTFRLF